VLNNVELNSYAMNIPPLFLLQKKNKGAGFFSIEYVHYSGFKYKHGLLIITVLLS